MELTTWAWIIIVVSIVGFVIYYLIQPTEQRKGESKTAPTGEVEGRIKEEEEKSSEEKPAEGGQKEEDQERPQV